jgi:hypothetical protein
MRYLTTAFVAVVLFLGAVPPAGASILDDTLRIADKFWTDNGQVLPCSSTLTVESPDDGAIVAFATWEQDYDEQGNAIPGTQRKCRYCVRR